MSKRLLFSLAASSLVLAACADSRTTLEPMRGGLNRVNAISEARFGGNPDFFFGAPLATTPEAGDANFDVGGSDEDIAPYIRVCETDGAASAAGCLTDVTLAVTGSPSGTALLITGNGEFYGGTLGTHPLDPAKNYRIEIWGLALSGAAQRATVDPRWLFGWRDITNGSSTQCTGDEAFCPQPYGVPIIFKTRIEQYAFCPTSRSCSTEFIAPNVDALLDAPLPEGSGAPNAQLFIPAQEGTGFAISFEPCTTAEDAAVSNSLDIPTFGPCLKTSTTFNDQLQIPAIISLCDELDSESFGISHEQEHQLSLHHLTSDLSVATALPEAHSCTSIASRNQNSLLRLASSVSRKLVGLVKPRTLHAAIPIDRGGGGMTNFLNSYFKLALPSKFEYINATDAWRRGPAGEMVTLSAKVTDLFGEPVRNARVRWSVASSPTPGASVVGATTVLTDETGIASATVQLSTGFGDNVFHARGRGIATFGALNCNAPSPDTSSCNGPRVSYDPFIPMHTPEFDPSGTELPIDIAEGTFLPFTVTCQEGAGTATADGVFTTAEWGCARSYNFTANVDGGSTPGTVKVMNDGTNIYLAVRLPRGTTTNFNKLQFSFDNDNDGVAEAGDGVLALDAAHHFIDAFLPTLCVSSTSPTCWFQDATNGGTNDGSGAIANNGTFTTYEISHPLNTADNAKDFSLSAGQNVGLFLTLKNLNGTVGTNWPGFRSYLSVGVIVW